MAGTTEGARLGVGSGAPGKYEDEGHGTTVARARGVSTGETTGPTIRDRDLAHGTGTTRDRDPLVAVLAEGGRPRHDAHVEPRP